MNPDDVEAMLPTAERLLHEERFHEAEQLLHQVVTANATLPRAWDLLGTAHFRLGDTSKAIEAFRRGLELAPGDPDRHFRLASLSRQVGDVKAAEEHLRVSLQLRPDFPQARDALARLGRQPTSVDAGAGELQYEGNRSLRSYAPRFLFAVALAVLALLRLGGALRSEGLSDTLSGVGRAQDRLDRLVATGFDSAAVSSARDSLARAEERAASWESVLDVAAWSVLALAGVLVILALVGSRLTHYRIHDRRIDITEGVLRRRRNSVWLYEITDTVYVQPLPLLLVGSGRLSLKTDRGTQDLIGFASSRQMAALWEEIRDAVVVQRHEIKGVWL